MKLRMALLVGLIGLSTVTVFGQEGGGGGRGQGGRGGGGGAREAEPPPWTKWLLKFPVW